MTRKEKIKQIKDHLDEDKNNCVSFYKGMFWKYTNIENKTLCTEELFCGNNAEHWILEDLTDNELFSINLYRKI